MALDQRCSIGFGLGRRVMVSELAKNGGSGMDYAPLMVAVYGAGVVSMAVLTMVGLGTALKAGRWVSTGYLAALGAVLAELARIGLKV